jgi:hypothetical protein
MVRLAWTVTLLFVLACIAGMIGMCHQAQSLFEMGFANFLPGWPQTAILQISVSQIVKITGLRHCTWL